MTDQDSAEPQARKLTDVWRGDIRCLSLLVGIPFLQPVAVQQPWFAAQGGQKQEEKVEMVTQALEEHENEDTAEPEEDELPFAQGDEV